MTSGAFDLALDMDPVREDDKRGKFVHPLPRNSFIRFNVSDDLYRLRPLADCIGRVASSAELDIRNPCGTVFFHISVAKVAVQLGDFLVVNMIKADRLINGLAFQNWEDRENERFHRNPKTKPCNRHKKKNEEDSERKTKPIFHFFSLFASLRVCQVKIGP
jgi:hypothetical protein